MPSAKITAVRDGEIEEFTVQGDHEEDIREEAILTAAKAFRIDDAFKGEEHEERLNLLESEMDVFRLEMLPEPIKPPKHDGPTLDAMFEEAHELVPEGTRWKHEKSGDIYVTAGHGINTATGTMMVRYRPLGQAARMFHREMAEWLDTNDGKPRFTLLANGAS